MSKQQLHLRGGVGGVRQEVVTSVSYRGWFSVGWSDPGFASG
jgi:hypothetical protein